MNTPSTLWFTCFMLLLQMNVWAQKVSLSGYIKDAQTGEALVGATVFFHEANINAISNAKGFYAVHVKQGEYTVNIGYLGYTTLNESLKVGAQATQQHNFALQASSNEIEEVVVSASRRDNVRKVEMGVEKLEMKSIKKIPALMGEVDVIKAIMLLPGVQPAAEGTSSFSVRGGSPDQNLILFDNATIYNASHLMGFFSVFNNDVIEGVKLYKGDIPAAYGGRLSSVLDVSSKGGDAGGYNVSGGVGLISSRLAIDGPIVKDKLSFMVAGRRTYADLFLPLASDENIKESVLHFYDLNGSLTYRPNERDRITLSGYYGRDNFGQASFAAMHFSNQSYSLNWLHQYNANLFSTVSLIGSGYDYEMAAELSSYDMAWQSAINSLGGRADFTYKYGENNHLRFGVSSTHHSISPNNSYSKPPNSEGAAFHLPKQFSLETAIFAMNEHDISERFALKYGLRFTILNNIGAYTHHELDDNYNLTGDSMVYGKGDFFNSYYGFEPRLGAVFRLGDDNSIKASYSRTMQFMHLVSNSTAGSPLDVWTPSTPNVRPQKANQVSVGYFHNFLNDAVETSVEVFYKHLTDVLDFKDHAIILLNDRLEAEFRRGIGRSYGVEAMVRKNVGKFTGWVSYTYSRSFRKVDEVNNNKWYQTTFDRPHSVNIVANYDITKRINVAASWTYATGMPTTFPEGRFEVDGSYIPIYGGRNTYRLDDYHRLDLAATFVLKKRKGYEHDINLSVYNAYGRHNTWYMQFVEEPRNSGNMFAERVYLFSVIPSITYNFKF
ncbi:MAG: TonB-dependent receptor [Bacteroidales bacterium]